MKEKKSAKMEKNRFTVHTSSDKGSPCATKSGAAGYFSLGFLRKQGFGSAKKCLTGLQKSLHE